jgi:hypothetical protein
MPRKPWTKMNAAELAKATAEFDSGPGPSAVPASKAELAKHCRAMRPAAKRLQINAGQICVNPRSSAVDSACFR